MAPQSLQVTLGRHIRRLSSTAVRTVAALLATVALSPTAWAAAGDGDLTALQLEDLLDLRVQTASRYAQSASEAPATVRVVTADDIRRHGWTTLAQALSVLPGIYFESDRIYTYIGARGFHRDGDYNTRYLLLVDGIRVNDPLYDQATLGQDFGIDLDVVERIEFLSGPGSATYGGNALMGVINVITRTPSRRPETRLAGGIGSDRLKSLRVSQSGALSDDVRFLLAASLWDAPGGDLYLPAFDTPEQNDGLAENLDGEIARRLFAKLAGPTWTAVYAYGRRDKDVPTANYDQSFNVPGSRVRDTQHLASFNRHWDLRRDARVNLQLFAGQYDFDGVYIYDEAPYLQNVDRGRGRWLGGDVNLRLPVGQRHQLLIGVEAREDIQVDQSNYDRVPYAVNLDSRIDGYRRAVYAQDAWQVLSWLTLDGGLRFDADSFGTRRFNPRLGAIATVSERTTLKLLYATAHRSPNAFERLYEIDGPGSQSANRDLIAEHLRTLEFVWGQRVGSNSQISLSAYHYFFDDLIVGTETDEGDLQYGNVGTLTGRGLELAWESRWHNQAVVRASYARQDIDDSERGDRPEGSPRQLLTVDVQSPRWLGRLSAAATFHAVGSRYGRSTEIRADSYTQTDLSLRVNPLLPGLSATLRVDDVFDQVHEDPVGPEVLPTTLPQPGRILWLELRFER